MNISYPKLLYVLVPALLLAAPAKGEWKVDDKLPALSSFTLTGDLPSLKDKVVLVDFWASWCGPCKQSFPVLDEIQKKYKDRGLIILAVNQDEKIAKMDRFLKANPVQFSVVFDQKHALAQAAGVQAMPSSYLIDAQGNIRFIHKGFKPESSPEEYVKHIEILLKELKENTK